VKNGSQIIDFSIKKDHGRGQHKSLISLGSLVVIKSV